MVPSIDLSATASTPSPCVFKVSALGETPLLIAYSTRVKAIDVHPTKTYVLAALYDGTVVVHDLATNTIPKTIQVSSSPVRTAKFIERMNWIITGSDDRRIRVFDFDTSELVAEFEAHEDYVRGLAVHPTLPLLLSCGDDKLTKVWDWTKNWACVRLLAGHQHYVMAITVSTDGRTIATASLDHDVRFWHIASLDATDSLADSESVTVGEDEVLTAHPRGLNAVAFDATAPKLVTASDDRTLRVWDTTTKRIVAELNGHTANVTSVLIHPTMSLIISGAEDSSARLWDTETYSCIGVWEHGLGRVWALAVVPTRNAIAIAYDRGLVVVTLPLSIGDSVNADGFVDVTEA